MSGLLGQLAGLFGGAGSQAPQANTWSGILSQLLASQGGLQGLLAQLQNAGLGEHVQSWVGTGENKPVTPEQLGAALPPAEVHNIAQSSGLQSNQLLDALSKLLPQAVDHATPTGQVPEAGAAPDLNAIIGRLLGR
jgi:uncharacterized protein YidB (DUF937 family)